MSAIGQESTDFTVSFLENQLADKWIGGIFRDEPIGNQTVCIRFLKVKNSRILSCQCRLDTLKGFLLEHRNNGFIISSECQFPHQSGNVAAMSTMGMSGGKINKVNG